MLRGRPAFASVYLCFVCLLSLPTPQPAAKLCTRDLIRKVASLIEKAPSLKSVDCRLYTPTIDDYKKCPSSTMKCFADESKVLLEEWKSGTSERLTNLSLNRPLEKLASQFNQTESECRPCELFREEEAVNFLKGLESTLQIMNSQHCGKIRPPRNFQKRHRGSLSSS